MSEKKWTPGPWYVGDEADPQYPSKISIEAEGVFVALVDEGHSEDRHKANARLIAVAPELYEALEGLLDITDDSENDADPEESIFAFARAALAKARGESK